MWKQCVIYELKADLLEAEIWNFSIFFLISINYLAHGMSREILETPQIQHSIWKTQIFTSLCNLTKTAVLQTKESKKKILSDFSLRSSGFKLYASESFAFEFQSISITTYQYGLKVDFWSNSISKSTFFKNSCFSWEMQEVMYNFIFKRV